MTPRNVEEMEDNFRQSAGGSVVKRWEALCWWLTQNVNLAEPIIVSAFAVVSSL